MSKRWIFTAALLALVVPVAAFAANGPSPESSAKAACTKLKASMGTSFAQAYPTFGACVSAYAPVEQQSVTSAQSTCSAQQADATFASTHGGKTFDQYYGTGKNGGKDAFGNCVSAAARASSQAEQQGRTNPAQTCRALRTQLTASVFASTYGANASDKNAFGKCVSRTAKAQSRNELSASAACTTEQNDPNFAAGHNGQTFDALYGTNDDKTNAFGKCVSSKAKAASGSEQHATVTAAKACATELKAGASAFKAKYRTFGRCVSQKTKA